MGYKLFFRATDGEISLNMFQNYFSKYPHFTVTGPEASYENENTGARFVFQYLHTNGEGNINVRPEGTYRIALNVEYCVPSFFVTEALLEVEALINETRVAIFDPQPYGIGTKEFNSEKMLDCWHAHNEAAIIEFVRKKKWEEMDVPLVSYDWLQRIWVWNYYMSPLKKAIDENVHVPPIMLFFDGEHTKSGVIWDNVGPIAMPAVDLVAMSIPSFSGAGMEYSVVEYSFLEGFIKKYSSGMKEDAHILEFEKIPKDINNFVKNLKPNQNYSILSMSGVLELEVVEDALLA